MQEGEKIVHWEKKVFIYNVILQGQKGTWRLFLGYPGQDASLSQDPIAHIFTHTTDNLDMAISLQLMSMDWGVKPQRHGKTVQTPCI